MDNDLFARVRERLLDATLWPLTDDHVIGGSGTNEPCAVCDQAITNGETEYEVPGPVMIAHSTSPAITLARRESAFSLTAN